MKLVLRPLALASELGMTMGLLSVGTVLAGLLLGSWIDRQFDTRPAATLLLTFVGVLAGLLGTINLAQSATRRINRDVAQHGQVRSVFSARDLGRALVLVLELALVTLAPVGLCLGLGLWLDHKLQSRPVFTIVLAVVSIVGASLAVYLVTAHAARRANHDSQEAA